MSFSFQNTPILKSVVVFVVVLLFGLIFYAVVVVGAGDVVYSAAAERITPQYSVQGKEKPLEKAMLFKSRDCILRAGRIILAGWFSL